MLWQQINSSHMNDFGNIVPLQIQVMCKAHEHTTGMPSLSWPRSVELVRRCIWHGSVHQLRYSKDLVLHKEESSPGIIRVLEWSNMACATSVCGKPSSWLAIKLSMFMKAKKKAHTTMLIINRQ
jgi:hypothetical protein